MDKIKTVKIKNPDGSVSEETYTISVDARNVDMENSKNLQETIGTVNVDIDGSIAEQLAELDSDKINMTDIIDNLNSSSNTKVLSAKQGKVLGDAVAALEAESVKKKAYFFDTVADMKAANLKDGDYACTLGYYSVNDGGAAEYIITNTQSVTKYQEELNNGLYSTLIIDNYVSPEQFGAYGDGTHDDTQFIIIALQKSSIVKGNKNYKITETINIVNNKQLDLKNVIYTGNNYAFTIHGRFNKIKINSFNSDNGGIFTTSLAQNTDQFIEWNQLEVCTSLTGKEVLYINAKENEIPSNLTYYGVQYNIFKFRRCILNENANCNTIHMEGTGNSSKVWLNENSFYDCAFLSHRGTVKYACYFKSNDIDNVRDNKFYNSSIEGVNDGVYLGNANINWYGGRFERSSINHQRCFERTGQNAPVSYIYGNDIVNAEYGIIVPDTPMKMPYFIIFSPFGNKISTRKGVWQKIWCTGIYETDGYPEFTEMKPGTTYGSVVDLTDIQFTCSPIIIKNDYPNNYMNLIITNSFLTMPNKKICEIVSDKDSTVSLNVKIKNGSLILEGITLWKNTKTILYAGYDNNIIWKAEPYNKSMYDIGVNSFEGKSYATYGTFIKSVNEIIVTTRYTVGSSYYIMTKNITKRILNTHSVCSFGDEYYNGTKSYKVRWTYNNGVLSLAGLYVDGVEITDYENVKTWIAYK